MAPISWYSTFESLFKDAIGDRKSIASKSYRKKNVLVMSESRLYVWLDTRHAILSVELNRLTQEEDEEVDGDEPSSSGEAMKLLLPSSPPSYDVTELVLEPAFGQRLALVGSKGVNVLLIPNISRTRDKNQERTLCSSMEIGERLLLNHPQCEVLGVKWHPGSNTHSHLLLLLSNNTLRVLDVKNNACVAVSIYQLGPHPVFRLSSTSTEAQSSFGAALGETAVDFDLGSPLKRRGDGEGAGAPLSLVWPLYILRGNGDVYSMYINQPHERNFRSSVKGPLSMHPPAEDNYGVDACSILCVPLQPPLLVIATSYGMIYHCVVLANEAQDEKDPAAATDSLFVYESIELDDIREGQPMEQGQPIRIFKDGSTASRYHCAHWNGVHTVALPLVPHLQSLSYSRTADEIADLVSSIEEQNCVVEHVVCTRPLSTSKSNPVIGLAVIYGIALGGTTLICLLGDYELLIIPLAATYLESLPRLLLNEQQAVKSGDGGQWSSELETSQVNKEPFDQQIRRILQRRNTNPIYKSNVNNASEPLLKDCLHLLNKSTRILREEYIQRMDLTHETIQERVKVLQDLKNQQLIEIEQLSANQIPSTDKAQHLAEKYEELKERQEMIVKRVENVLGGLLKNAPMLSEAERGMKRELLSIEEKSKHLKNSMKQIRAKQSQRNLTIDRQRSNNFTQRSTQVNQLELQQIKEFLIQETNSLTSMTEQLKQIQLMLDL